jgi:molybdopterin-guanine dinucleotide biosynthesis protein A
MITKPYVLTVSGLKNSGKTTYIEVLIPILKRMGYRVAAFKHDAHDFVPDVPGTDSFRFGQAGADSVAVYSDSRYLLTQRRAVGIEELLPHVSDHDIVLVEGGKSLPYPKIALVRRGIAEAPVTRERLVAVATDTDYADRDVPTLPLDDHLSAAVLIARQAGAPSVPSERPFGSAAILAGGKSSRMGFDKKLLSVDGRCLIELLAEKLGKRFSDVFVVSNTPLPDGVALECIPDSIVGCGPPGGFHAALCRARSHYVYITACDMPQIDLDYVDYMRGRLEENARAACLTRQGSFFEPFHAFYGKGMLPGLAANLLQGDSSVKRWLDAHDVDYVAEARANEFTPDWKLFQNLNTQEDWQSWLDARSPATMDATKTIKEQEGI